MQPGTAAVERVFREEYGRLIASLVRRFDRQMAFRRAVAGAVGPHSA
jgi:hypothetical protein